MQPISTIAQRWCGSFMSSIPGSQDPRGGCTYIRRSSRLEGEGGGVTIIAIMPQASGHGARPVPVSEWMHLYSISSCTIQPSFLSLVFNHPTSAPDFFKHLRSRAAYIIPKAIEYRL